MYACHFVLPSLYDIKNLIASSCYILNISLSPESKDILNIPMHAIPVGYKFQLLQVVIS